MTAPAFGRRALLFGVLLLPACAREVPPEPVAAPAVVEPPSPAPPKPRKPARGANVGGGAAGAIGGLLVGGAPAPAEAQTLKVKYQAFLVGTWTADLGDGYREERTYGADGTYTATLTGPMPATVAGKYAVLQAVGTKALKVRLGDDPDARTITVSFDGDLLEHPSLRPGVTGTFRKK